MHPPASSPSSVGEPDGTITVYWRKGCGFCKVLRARLRRAGVRFDEVDIWQDRAAAAFVRSVADGNETVPTVRIGQRTLVNPSAADVISLARSHAPDAVAALAQRPARPGGVLARLRRGTRSR